MYAIIETGGKQFRVSPGDVIQVERLDADPASQIEIGQVLAIHDDEKIQVGTPLVTNAQVVAEIEDHLRGKKIIVFKMKRRKGLHRRQGHRQELTKLRIVDFIIDGKSLTGAAASETEGVEAESAE